MKFLKRACTALIFDFAVKAFALKNNLGTFATRAVLKIGAKLSLWEDQYIILSISIDKFETNS